MLQSRDNTKAPAFTLPKNFLRRRHRTSKSPSPPLLSPRSTSPPPQSPMSTFPLSIPRSTSPASTISSTEYGDDRFQRTGTSLFHRARHFVLNNPVIQQIQCEGHLNHTLERLSRHIMPGASFDCAAKDPPPRCYPGTRCYIIDKATNWLRPPYRAKNILWFSGPAGVGKTAIMRTLADAEAASKRLGAAVFFSKHRQNKRDSVKNFVPTLAYQLAVEVPLYQRFVTEKLTADPQLLEKGMNELFQALIVEPFGHQNLCGDLGHRLILIDGLDECNGGEHAQQEIVEMIGDFVQQYPTSPLVWIIASRPEPHLSAAFSHPSVAPNCMHERIAIDTPEACKDVEVYLQSEFTRMRRRFAPHIPEGQEWPSRSQVVLIVRAASGLFIFATTVVRFIGDPKIGNPVRQLKSVIHAIEKSKISPLSQDNPLAGLHNLYLEILKTIPRPTYAQVTGRILGCCDLLPRNTVLPTPFMLSCNFLGIEQNDAYASLQRLHSVLDIPSPLEAATREIKVLHSSFTDFLRNRSASQEFYIKRHETAADIARCSFRILQEVNSDAGPFPRVSNIGLSWEHRPEQTREMLLKTAYDCFRLMTVTVLDRGFDASFTLAERIALLSQADFSKLDCYLPPDIKTSVYDTRTHHKCLFDWLLNQWKSTPEAFQKSELVKELPLKRLDKHSIRTDRAVIHFMFTGKDGSVVRPKVYSDHEGIREKYRGDTLEAFNKVLRPHRQGSSNQIQMWGKDPAKTCLLFECKPAPDHYVDGNLVVKEIFFIPYLPRKK